MNSEENHLREAITAIAADLLAASGATAVRVYGRELDVVATAGKLAAADGAVVLGAVRRAQRSAAHLLGGGVLRLELAAGKIVVAAAARRLYLAVVVGKIGDGDGNLSEAPAEDVVAVAQAKLHRLILGGPAAWGGGEGGGGGGAAG